MYNKKKVFGVLPAAGSGKRMQSVENKLWLNLGDYSIVERTIRAFIAADIFDALVLVVREDERARFEKFLHNLNLPLPIHITIGGKERQDSVLNGLRLLRELTLITPKSIVAVHDAARALITPQLLREAVAGACKYRAVGVGVPVKDTIKQVNKDQIIIATPERSALWAIHTPQVFEFDLLLRSYELLKISGKSATDDCQVVENAGYNVKMLLSSYENIKITTPEDIDLAKEILRRREKCE